MDAERAAYGFRKCVEERQLMVNDIQVSIITVCYNSERTIRRTIESVLHQTYENIEYIIIDGASKDKTCQIIAEYQSLFGRRLKAISEPDQGIYDAMNKGIRMSTGKLIGIINSDDFYEENAVERIVTSWDCTGMQILHGLMRQLRNGKEYGVILTSADFLHEKMIQHPSCFVTRDVYRKIGLFNTKYKYVADSEFMMRAYEAGVIFKPVYHVIANFEEGGVSESAAAQIEGFRLSRKRGEISHIVFWMLCIFGPIKSMIYRRIWK